MLVAALPAPALSQDEAALKSFFEGKYVTVKIDMPGTQEGVDLHVDTSRPLDYEQYGYRLKAYGPALRAGESTTVTLVKVKKDLIEFQLGGGGFGTLGDDTSTSVYMPLLGRSEREEKLARAIRDEDDSRRRAELRRELDELEDRRERENRRIREARAEAELRKSEEVAERRLRGGSRFNLRYSDRVPSNLDAQDVMAALSAYVDFSSYGFLSAHSIAAVDPVALPQFTPQPIDADRLLHKGELRAEIERTFGAPVASSERREGSMTVVTLVFVRGDERLSADFVGDVLIGYSLTSR
jgi:hypothetical protein